MSLFSQENNSMRYRQLTEEENEAYTTAVKELCTVMPWANEYLTNLTPCTINNDKDSDPVSVFFIDPHGRICVPFRTINNTVTCMLNPTEFFHQILHFLRKSFFSAETDVISENQLGYDPQIYVDAHCLTINDNIISLSQLDGDNNFIIPDNIFSPEKLNLPTGLLVKEYVDLLIDRGTLPAPNETDYDLRCKFMLIGEEELENIDTVIPRPSKNDSDDTRANLKLALLLYLREQASDQDGNVFVVSREAGDSVVHADDIVLNYLNNRKSTVDWRSVLASALRGVKKPAWKNPHPTFSRSNRYNPTNFILPGSADKTCDVLVGVDTSGSMESLLKHALVEVEEIITETDVTVQFFSVDDKVSDISLVNKASDISLSGLGGTDMRVAYKFAEKIDTDMFILLTDGYTRWPKKKTQFLDSTVTCILYERNCPPGKEQKPPFGRVILIPID